MVGNKLTCGNCHFKGGMTEGGKNGGLSPPPDFTVYSLSPEKTFGVITNGYPGTTMSSFGSLTADVRWGLVKIINEKRSL